jgi:RNA polymerase sigma factor (sigma-70 family)
MAHDEGGLKRLMARVCAGDQDAVRVLLDEYGAFLLHVIRRKLSAELRTHFDSADFTQAVWASFFTGPLQDYHFNSPQELLRFLVGLARHKLCDAARQRRRQKRNASCTHSLDGSAAYHAETLRASEPTASQIALAEEQWDRLLRGQPDHYRRILVLLREGHTRREVARELSINERTVHRVVRLAATRLTREGSP